MQRNPTSIPLHKSNYVSKRKRKECNERASHKPSGTLISKGASTLSVSGAGRSSKSSVVSFFCLECESWSSSSFSSLVYDINSTHYSLIDTARLKRHILNTKAQHNGKEFQIILKKRRRSVNKTEVCQLNLISSSVSCSIRRAAPSGGPQRDKKHKPGSCLIRPYFS